MAVNESSSNIEVIKLCPASFLLRVPQAGVAWIFNPWSDISKILIQKELDLNGVVYPDRRMQKGVSCNLIEFPLWKAMLIQGMYFRGEKPCLIGTPGQLQLAGEGFRRGFYGFYDVSEMDGCDLSEEEMHGFMQEIKGLALNEKIQEVDELLELVSLQPLEEHPTIDAATEYNGLRIWKKDINVFGVVWENEEVTIDCNLGEGETYTPPLKIDVKNIPYTLFQIIDTGEEDGFSSKSCMHTVIQWRDKIICVDLPMNVSYLLNKISVSPTEIDAVIFTHNHDDHIGELSMLLQMDKKVTVICPRIIWKSILLKASNVFGMSVDELSTYFDYRPIRYGKENEYDYSGLRIEAHPSIHSVPCTVYRFRGIVDREWKIYSHLSDLLVFERCQALIKKGHITQKRFDDYREFLLAPATVKKIDVGTRDGGEEFSVHGSWKDFMDDVSEHIVLAHSQQEHLDEEATVMVGQVAVAGSSRNMSERFAHTYQDKYRERALRYLAEYLFALLAESIDEGVVEASQIRDYLRIIADNEIRLIQPNTPFLKMGEKATFVDMVISGVGSVWKQKERVVQIASVNAGDLIGDMGVLQEIPRTATIRADTYMHVLRIPGDLFREIAILLKLFIPNGEGVLQKIWRHREIVQTSSLFGEKEVPVYLQNKIAQDAVEVKLKKGETVCPTKDKETAIFLGSKLQSFVLKVRDEELPQDRLTPPVFGANGFLNGNSDQYEAIAREDTAVLRLDREKFDWILEVPIFKLQLRQLIEQRSIHVQRAKKGK